MSISDLSAPASAPRIARYSVPDPVRADFSAPLEAGQVRAVLFPFSGSGIAESEAAAALVRAHFGPGAQVLRAPSGRPYAAGPSGAPLAGCGLSFSHAQGVGLCALASFPIGADLERERPAPPRAVRSFAPDEQEMVRQAGDAGFFTLWTRKEALAKLTGLPLRAALAHPVAEISSAVPPAPEGASAAPPAPALAHPVAEDASAMPPAPASISEGAEPGKSVFFHTLLFEEFFLSFCSFFPIKSIQIVDNFPENAKISPILVDIKKFQNEKKT